MPVEAAFSPPLTEQLASRKRFIDLFSDFGGPLTSRGILRGAMAYPRYNIHAYWRIMPTPNQVLHIEGFTRFDRGDKMTVQLSLLDRAKMFKIRKAFREEYGQQRDGVGAELGAIIRTDMTPHEVRSGKELLEVVTAFMETPEGNVLLNPNL